MAYSPSEKYPGAVDVDPDYQGGKFRDNNPSTTNNGSPLKAIDRNELLARDEAIMNDAGFEYNGLPDTPQDSQLFKAYKASLGNGANLLSNHNFLIQTPDGSQPLPDATPRSYPPGYQIFSGVFANEITGITNLTYIDGRVSFSGGDLYFAVPNTGAIARLTSDQLTASVADFDGKPRTRGVSFALVGDEYRITVTTDALEDVSSNPTPLGSVKFEQGSVATGHEVQNSKGQTYTFNTVAEMVGSGAPVGSKVQWLGYYKASDGGSNWGTVKKGTHTQDGGSIFSLDANTYIEANLSRTVSIKKFGLGLSGSPLVVVEQTTLAQNCADAVQNIKFDADCTVNELDVSTNTEIIICAGITLTYTPTANSKFLFAIDGVSNKEFSGRGFIKNTAARQSGGAGVVDTFSGTGAIHALNCSNIHTSGIQFDEGSHCIFFENTDNSSMRKHRAKNQQSWAYITSDAEAVTVKGNYGTGNATDCFKFRGQSRYLVISSNIAEGNFSDGFDLFDGFFKSILTNNIARNNTNFGFECKGTPSVDYNFRDSTISNNIAQGNGLQGFSIVSVRGCTFSANVSTENLGNGFTYDGCQENVFVGDVASKNAQHGFDLGNTSSVSRNQFSACIGVNNSKDNDGVYSNWYFSPVADGNELHNCRGFKGTGGDTTNPAYGAFFATGSTGNKIIGGTFEPNVTGSFGGDVGAQFITQAGVTGGLFTQNFSLGSFTSGPVTPSGYMIVNGDDGNQYKVAAEPV